MKKTLLAIALLSASASAMAVDPYDPVNNAYFDGYSTLTFSTQAFAQGNENQTSGGFCSITDNTGCAGTTAGINTAEALGAAPLESASGAGVLDTTGTLALITPVSSGALGNAANAGTYTSINAVTNGGYVVQGRDDPGSMGVANGSTYAMQKPEMGVAGSSTFSDSVASTVKGQSNSFSNIDVQAQAVTPN